MSGFVTRGTAARLAVLLVVAALVLSVSYVVSSASRTGPPPVTADELIAQSLRPVGTLAPAATPRPAPKPAAVRSQPAVKQHRAAVRHRRTHPGRRARGARHARPALSWWRSNGGRDIGWPQCPHDVGFRGRNGLGQPMPDPGVRFVVVGLTNGRAFTPNPCLDRHLRWVRNHHARAAAYAFATYPTRAQLRRYRHRGPYDGRHLLGALRNAGHAAARYNIQTMRRHHFTTPHVWLDVEPSSSRPWSRRTVRNRQVVQGWIRAYREAGYTVGFYSTPYLWREILGHYRPRLPEWRTGGPVSARAALRKCHGESIQGGRAVIAQWWTAHRDFDRLCATARSSGVLARYFHQW